MTGPDREHDAWDAVRRYGIHVERVEGAWHLMWSDVTRERHVDALEAANVAGVFDPEGYADPVDAVALGAGILEAADAAYRASRASGSSTG